jgi:hypothetical protein
MVRVSAVVVTIMVLAMIVVVVDIGVVVFVVFVCVKTVVVAEVMEIGTGVVVVPVVVRTDKSSILQSGIGGVVLPGHRGSDKLICCKAGFILQFTYPCSFNIGLYPEQQQKQTYSTLY